MKNAIKRISKPFIFKMADKFGSHRRSPGSARLWVLMYHRILPTDDRRSFLEEPGMVVRPETFDMHLREVKRHFEPVTLSAWLQAWKAGEALPKRACAITFDDGWKDNYEYAFPILKERNVPATLFAVADKIGTDFQFWPNIVAALLHVGAADTLLENPVRRRTGVGRQGLNRDRLPDLIQRLKSYSDDDIFQALDGIDWRSLCKHTVEPALMDWEQLRAMHASGLIDVGSHTCSHRRLDASVTPEALSYEVVHSKDQLEEGLGCPVNLFCFPNGDYNLSAMELVKSTYQAAVTTRRGINRKENIELHQITRIGMHEDISQTPTQFSARLSGWV